MQVRDRISAINSKFQAPFVLITAERKIKKDQADNEFFTTPSSAASIGTLVDLFDDGLLTHTVDRLSFPPLYLQCLFPPSSPFLRSKAHGRHSVRQRNPYHKGYKLQTSP
jgi:hypothetical protein